MSMFKGPNSHAANPPETWEVCKAGERSWHLTAQDGTVLERYTTKRAAEIGRTTDGTALRLYAKEARWYAGETVSPWKDYAECHEENLRIAQRWPDGPMAAQMVAEFGADVLAVRA